MCLHLYHQFVYFVRYALVFEVQLLNYRVLLVRAKTLDRPDLCVTENKVNHGSSALLVLALGADGALQGRKVVLISLFLGQCLLLFLDLS